MEWLTIAQQLGLTPLNLVLGGMLYLLMAHLGIAPAPWKEEEEEKVPLWAQNLQQYFNHDTTKQHQETHKKLDNVKDELKDVNRTLSEIKEYGIKCREIEK